MAIKLKKINNYFLLVFIFIAMTVFLMPIESQAVGIMRAIPPKVRLNIPPGSVKTGSITVENPTDSDKYVKVYLEDWYYISTEGSKDFKPAGTTELSCAPWISFVPAELKLAPYSKQHVNYTVKIPEGATGGHYAILFLENTAPPSEADSEGVGLSLAIRIGCLFYIEPEGTIKRTAEFNNLKLEKKHQAPLTINLDFTNTGNVDLTVGGSFNIIDKKGLVFARGEFNDVYTFPNGTAVLTSSWKEAIPKGKYDLILTIDLGKALEEVNMGRGPIILKEAEIEIGSNGQITSVGQMR